MAGRGCPRTLQEYRVEAGLSVPLVRAPRPFPRQGPWSPGLTGLAESRPVQDAEGFLHQENQPPLESVKRRLVPGGGVEPPRPCGHMDLNHARLPIPPPGRVEAETLEAARLGVNPHSESTCPQPQVTGSPRPPHTAGGAQGPPRRAHAERRLRGRRRRGPDRQPWPACPSHRGARAPGRCRA